jgi:hypothetical protein
MKPPCSNIRSFITSLILITNEVFSIKFTNNLTRLEWQTTFSINKNKRRGLSPQARTTPTERPPLVGEVSANFSV